jgi:hypothetical protein
MGRKKVGKHQSLDQELVRPCNWLRNQPEARRLILGPMEPCRHHYTAGHIKVLGKTPGGISLKAYSGRGVRKMFVITDDPDNLLSRMKRYGGFEIHSESGSD